MSETQKPAETPAVKPTIEELRAQLSEVHDMANEAWEARRQAQLAFRDAECDWSNLEKKKRELQDAIDAAEKGEA
jgi:hypothetical protein